LALSFAYLAVVFAFASTLAALGADLGKRRIAIAVSFAFLGASGLSATVAGSWVLLPGAKTTATLALGLPWLHWHMRLDALSGFFLVVIGLLVGAVSWYGPGYVRELTHGKQPLSVLGVFTGLFVAGMLLVPLADDAFAFMVAWELMSVSSYFLVTYQHQHAANRRAGFLYLLMAHVGALSILLGFGVLANFGDGFTFDAMRGATLTPAWASIAFALVFFGFGMKAGMVPLHAWLPEAHPAAPSHVSALMSGIMLKVAIYGLIRITFDLIGDIQWQWGLAVLVLGSASSLLGVLYALMQHDLKRLLAFHSVENIGIILIGIGLSMIFIGTNHPVRGVLGLIAALYHTLNHALFKGLLFLGAGAVLHASGENDLNRMGGLIKRMPQTAVFFLVGCIAISALPPLNGFVSEWLTFQSALQAPVLESGVLRSLIPASAAILALSGALAAACFVKVYGVAFLGVPRTEHAAKANEVAFGMRAAMALLALLCLAFGIFPATVINIIDSVPRLLLGHGLIRDDPESWLWLTPIAPEVASYAAPLVIAAIALIALVGYLSLHWRKTTVRRGYPWDCGYGSLSPRMQYTATAFAMPIRRIFAPAWRVEEKIDDARDPAQPLQTRTLNHELHVEDKSWPVLYEPIGRLVLAAARRASRIQTGNIHTYLIYSFVTLLLLLWVVS
jgi:formate hydrogenlyase subunit 3/multisubunit Na+/H+ antiporter MnhD subunit